MVTLETAFDIGVKVLLEIESQRRTGKVAQERRENGASLCCFAERASHSRPEADILEIGPDEIEQNVLQSLQLIAQTSVELRERWAVKPKLALKGISSGQSGVH